MIGGLLSMKNSLMKKDESIIRILDVKGDKVFVSHNRSNGTRLVMVYR